MSVPLEWASYSDHELMARCAHGEEVSFEELVRRYQQQIVDYLTRLTGNSSRAEELGQEVFIRIYQHRKDYTREAGFATWCYAITTNIARDELRSMRRRPRNHGAECLDSMATDGADPASKVHSAERATLVRKTLEQLPEHFREPLVLRDLQGRSYEEIASILQMELGTVKSRINRARIAFKEAFLSAGGLVEEGLV